MSVDSGELIPRITFREIADAEMMAVMITTTANILRDNIRVTNSLVMAEALGFNVVTVTSGLDKELTPTEMLPKQLDHMRRLVEMGDAINQELFRLREGNATAKEAKFEAEFSAALNKMREMSN